jgi:hypothetical protein
MIIDGRYSQSEDKQCIQFLNHPGSAYLRVMQYYQEEKEWNISHENTTENWEKFLSQYFAENIEMNIKLFHKEKLYYEISKKSF